MPFLVTHGPWIAKLLIGAWFVAGLLSERAVARRRAREEPEPAPAAAAYIANRPPVGWARARRHASTVVIALVWTGLGYAGLDYIGKLICKHYRSAPRGLVRDERPAVPWPLQIAAAMPGAYVDALDAIDHELEHMRQTPETRELDDELLELAVPCSEYVDILALHGEFAAALARGPSCASQLGYVRALAMVGRYDDAHAQLAAHPELRLELDPHQLEVIAIAVGDWRLAAEAADREATKRDARIRSEAEHTVGDQSVAEDRCRAAWYRWKAGEPVSALEAVVASGQSATGVGRERGLVCRLDLALAHPSAERLAALDALADELPLLAVESRDLIAVFQWAAGKPSDHTSHLAATAVLKNEPGFHAAVWLAAAAKRHGATDGGTAADSVVLDELRADNAAVDADLAAAHAANPPVDPNELAALDAAVKLHAGGANAPTYPSEWTPSCALLTRDTIDNAWRGSGPSLTGVLELCAFDEYAFVPVLLAVLPKVTYDRSNLMQHITATELIATSSPLELLQHALQRRDMYKLGGDAERAAEWQTIIDRQLAAFFTPEAEDRLLGLVLLEMP